MTAGVRRGAAIACGLAAAVLGAAIAIVVTTRGPAPAGRPITEAAALAYILDHPEILPEAMDRLEARDAAAAITAHRARIETPFAGAWAGDPKGDVVLVEFFDYACGYCRAALPDIDRLLAEDKRLKLVFRELPILSDASDKAARVSLAAAERGSFIGFHRALYRAGPLDEAAVARVSTEAGVSASMAAAALTDKAIAAEIDGNVALARALKVSGTPAFVVGDRVISGAIGYDGLKAAIAEARARRG